METSLCILLFLISSIPILVVSGQCLSDQKALLLQFRSNLVFNSSLSTKLQSWNPNTDCCSWRGVDCSPSGQVTGIDLNNEAIYGGIGSSGGGLFGLRSLQKLNLANNNFNFTPIPPGFGNLTSLTHLNLSNLFSGQIPRELSSLTRLVVLDLSSLFAWKSSLKLENPSLAVFVQNFTQLTELYLDGVNIAAARGNEWGRAISDSLPNLSVLSMSSCNLSGPIDESLGKLRSLSIVRLSLNKLSTHVPEFFASFRNLTVLRLSSCHLNGSFPRKIFQLPTLQTLDLTNNELVGSLPPGFPVNGSLQSLLLSHTNFFGVLPDSIGNLGMLSRLELANSNFSGPIPQSMQNLRQLTYLDLSSNNFTGSIPSLQSSKNLTHIDLSRNGLSGLINSSHFDGFKILFMLI